MREILIPVASFAAGCVIIAIFFRSPVVLALLAASVAAFSAGIVVSKFLLKTKEPEFKPKILFQGNVGYISPNDGFVLLQTAMSRMGLAEEKKKGGQ